MEVFVFETELGHTAFARREKKILALSFGHRSAQAAIKSLDQKVEISAPVECVRSGENELVDRVIAFARGDEVGFEDLKVDIGALTEFGRTVIAACRKIPWGETRTYGELAELAGRPGAARAVGSIMARNLVPLLVPCHRVVPASGGLGGFSAPQGVVMKRRLLEMESRVEASM